jgi:hypothetical protein
MKDFQLLLMDNLERTQANGDARGIVTSEKRRQENN